MRQIVLDTETTGLETSKGHRIIEIGCVEIVDRRLTGRHFHQYVQPEREVDEGAFAVHGISDEFLQDKPVFKQVIDEFLDYVNDAELVIHNAPFDIGFLDYELSLAGKKYGTMEKYCTFIDSLALARSMHPGQKNNLDALCKRYGVDNSQRELHGALLDAEILADVYLAMTGGQTDLDLAGNQLAEPGTVGDDSSIRRLAEGRNALKVIKANEKELEEHSRSLEKLNQASGDNCLWLEQAKSGAP
jgi:DNA polymerase-3 subunit epsilon